MFQTFPLRIRNVQIYPENYKHTFVTQKAIIPNDHK